MDYRRAVGISNTSSQTQSVTSKPQNRNTTNVSGPTPSSKTSSNPAPPIKNTAAPSIPKKNDAPSQRQQRSHSDDIHRINSPTIDIGANLTGRAFSNNLDLILKRAEEANLSHILITGTSLKASGEASKLCEQHNGANRLPVLKSTAGVHPHDAGRALETKNWLERLRKLAEFPDVVAVGECGLDYNRMFSTFEQQREMSLARELSLPVFLHERDAHDDFLAILREFPTVEKVIPTTTSRSKRYEVVHCYTDSDANHLDAFLMEGCHIGITGWVTDERRGKVLASIVNRIPLEKLMIETDAPFLTPRNSKNLRRDNEPAYLGWVVKKLAECYNVSEEEIAKRTTENALSSGAHHLKEENMSATTPFVERFFRAFTKRNRLIKNQTIYENKEVLDIHRRYPQDKVVMPSYWVYAGALTLITFSTLNRLYRGQKN
ncbi:deoxyribonuclease [Planoprotostelium fungivorum]|uniref:Deoxyribonuclease n=1 Tax=Planoprotostelium fungivorum TaxID=1890364 RepID=A0A2P6NRP5_9EUKA|nr:deoxyribonuclease [Planoprotostelium fungivorum]